MFTVLYRWRVKLELEQQFVESWSEITEYYLNNFEGARGSRLHRGSDGFWHGYAQWESDEHRQNAFKNRLDSPAREKLFEAIEESFPEIRLEIVADFLKSPDKS